MAAVKRATATVCLLFDFAVLSPIYSLLTALLVAFCFSDFFAKAHVSHCMPLSASAFKKPLRVLPFSHQVHSK